MKGVQSLLRDQPALVGTIVSAFVGLVIALGVNAATGGAVGGVLTVLAGVWIKSQVYNAKTVVALTNDAAVRAVTASSPTDTGPPGTLTDSGAATAATVARNVLGTVSGPAADG